MYEAHILIRVPGRKPVRRRPTIPAEFSRTTTEREAWAEREHEKAKREVLETPAPQVSVPTVAEFEDRFLAYGKANRQKASTQYARAHMMKKHILPFLGTKRLDPTPGSAPARSSRSCRATCSSPRTGFASSGSPGWAWSTPRRRTRASGRSPLTKRLAAALRRIRHLGSDAVLVQDDGRPVTTKALRGWLKRAQRRAKLPVTGNFYTLRRTFCSHVAMRGQPPKVLAELMGHEDIAVTNRYMHLTPGARGGDPGARGRCCGWR